jgi:hypothetical protein
MKTVQDLVAFSQANIAALADSGRILAAGVQELSQHAVTASQAQFTSGMAHLQSLSGVTSIERVLELQSRALRASVETGIAETGRLAEATFKLVERAAAPITLRAEAAMQVFSTAA